MYDWFTIPVAVNTSNDGGVLYITARTVFPDEHSLLLAGGEYWDCDPVAPWTWRTIMQPAPTEEGK